MTPDNVQAAALFAQLGNATRLGIIKILVECGESGIKVGQIQQEMGIPASTLSHHLLHLKNVGLIDQQRQGNALYCSVQYDKINAAMDYLRSECCIREETQSTDQDRKTG